MTECDSVLMLQNLTSLDISDNNIGCMAILEISKLTNLTTLNLSKLFIYKFGSRFGEIAKLTNLTSLNISYNRIGYKDTVELSKLTKLKSLNLTRSNIGPKSVDLLLKLDNLEI